MVPESIAPGPGTARGRAVPRGRLARLLSGVLGLLLTLGLLGVLAVAVSALVRMAVVRDVEPGFHLPTFLVVYALVLGPIGFWWLRSRSARDGAALSPLFENTLTLATGRHRGRAVARLEFAASPEATPRTESLVVSTVSEEDLSRLERIIEGGPRRPDRGDDLDRIALTPLDIGLLAAGSESLRRPLLAVMLDGGARVAARGGRRVTAEQVARWADVWAEASVGYPPSRDELAALEPEEPQEPDELQEPPEGREDEPATRPGPARARTRRESTPGPSSLAGVVHVAGRVLVGLYVAAVVAMLALTPSGLITRSPWDAVSGITVLGGPFVIWGWFGFVRWVRMIGDRSGPRARRAASAREFWNFGLVSSWLMVLIALLVGFTGWVMDDDWSMPLVWGSLAALVLFVGLGSLSSAGLRRWSERRDRDARGSRA